MATTGCCGARAYGPDGGNLEATCRKCDAEVCQACAGLFDVDYDQQGESFVPCHSVVCKDCLVTDEPGRHHVYPARERAMHCTPDGKLDRACPCGPDQVCSECGAPGPCLHPDAERVYVHREAS